MVRKLVDKHIPVEIFVEFDELLYSSDVVFLLTDGLNYLLHFLRGIVQNAAQDSFATNLGDCMEKQVSLFVFELMSEQLVFIS